MIRYSKLNIICISIILFIFEITTSLLIINHLNANNYPKGIIIDNTFGNAKSLELNGMLTYTISPEDGKMINKNLFFSFEQFNLHRGETAFFKKMNSSKNNISINNIISRITNGRKSFVSGKISSDFENINVFFFNPSGFVFSEYASLDINGSLHLYATEFIKFGNHNYTINSDKNLISELTVEPEVISYFLKPDSEIVINGSKIQNLRNISIVSSNISINDTTISIDSHNKYEGINIIGKNIAIKNSSLIAGKSNEDNSGSIYIIANEFISGSDKKNNDNKKNLNNSLISATNSQFITNSSKNSGNITIKGGNLIFKGIDIESRITEGGIGGNINIISENNLIVLNKENSISATAFGMAGSYGYAGDISIQATNIFFTNISINSEINTNGTGGNIYIKAKNSFTLYGNDELSTSISTDTFAKKAHNSQAGNIILTADSIHIEQAKLECLTEGPGKGGNINLYSNNLLISNGKILSSSTLGKDNAGDAGLISIDANNNIKLIDNSIISSSADSAGGGKISIRGTKFINISDSSITTSVHNFEGDAGDINLNSKIIVLRNGKIKANAYEGDGGAININTNSLFKSHDSQITSNSVYGNQGSIDINTSDLDISEVLSVNTALLPPDNWSKTLCDNKSNQKISLFLNSSRNALPETPEDWRPSPIISFKMIDEFTDANIDVKLLIIKGEEEYEKGNFYNAKKYWQKALKLLPEDCPLAIFIQNAICKIYCSYGFIHKALYDMNLLEVKIRNNKSSFIKAVIYNSLADIYLTMGHQKKASGYFTIALNYAERSKNLLILASTNNNIGNLKAVNNNFLESDNYYDECLSIIQDTGFEQKFFIHLAAKAIINRIRLRYFDSQYENIDTDIINATNFIIKEQISYDQVFDLISLGILTLKYHNKYSYDENNFFINKSLEIFQYALANSKILNNHILQAYIYFNLGKIYESLNDYNKALKNTQRALYYSQSQYCPEIVYQIQWQIAREYYKLEDIDSSLKEYHRAIQTLKPIKFDFFIGYRRNVNLFKRKIKPLFLELTKLYLNLSKDEIDEIQRRARLEQAQDVLEQLKADEINNYFDDVCITYNKNYLKKSINDSDTVLIYPVCFKDHISTLLIFNNDKKYYEVNVELPRLLNEITEFLKYLQTDNKNEKKIGISLFNLLIAHFEDELIHHKIKNIVIAPDNILRLIPFSALYTGTEYLIEKYGIVTIPSIRLTDLSTTLNSDLSILLNGLSTSRRGRPALKYVNYELNEIASLFKNNYNMLLNENYTENNLKAELQQGKYKIIHFATHGKFGIIPENNYIMAFDKDITMNRWDKLTTIIKHQNHKIELLTLSACETAIGNELSALGMASIALKAGVKSSIASLWCIDDKATSIIMAHFYNNFFRARNSKIKALQLSQIEMIKSREYSHPMYWSPFILIGNWY